MRPARYSRRRPAASVSVAIGDALIAALNDPEPAVRAAAAEALGWVREARAEQALRDRFAFFREGPDAETALQALARMASPASAGVFRRALTSREACASTPGSRRASGGCATARRSPALSAMAEREREPGVLVATAFAFYLLGERSNLQRLVEALLVPDVARQARAYLTELGAASAAGAAPVAEAGRPGTPQSGGGGSRAERPCGQRGGAGTGGSRRHRSRGGRSGSPGAPPAARPAPGRAHAVRARRLAARFLRSRHADRYPRANRQSARAPDTRRPHLGRHRRDRSLYRGRAIPPATPPRVRPAATGRSMDRPVFRTSI